MLSKPDCVFTIPSLHDSLELDGRLYFPRRTKASPDRGPYVQGFAILAHPYAPLGGSWDDPIVQLVGATVLKAGFILNTFNFRGAAGSAGSTSWTGNAEAADYVTFCAIALFIINQDNFIDLLRIDPQSQSPTRPILVLGGYSYGSLIASSLPEMDVLLKSLENTAVNTIEHKLAERAHELSTAVRGFFETQNTIVSTGSPTAASQSPSSPSRSLVLGGYDRDVEDRRASRDSARKPSDGGRVRRSLDRVKHRFALDADHDRNAIADHSSGMETQPLPLLPLVAYLLVSPLLPPVSSLITLFQRPSFRRKQGPASRTGHNLQDKLSLHATLAIYGDRDKFTSATKLRDWSRGIEQKPGSQFSYQMIEGAGHFWIEDGAAFGLRDGVANWLDKLANNMT